MHGKQGKSLMVDCQSIDFSFVCDFDNQSPISF